MSLRPYHLLAHSAEALQDHSLIQDLSEGHLLPKAWQETCGNAAVLVIEIEIEQGIDLSVSRQDWAAVLPFRKMGASIWTKGSGTYSGNLRLLSLLLSASIPVHIRQPIPYLGLECTQIADSA